MTQCSRTDFSTPSQNSDSVTVNEIRQSEQRSGTSIVAQWRQVRWYDDHLVALGGSIEDNGSVSVESFLVVGGVATRGTENRTCKSRNSRRCIAQRPGEYVR
jgi:hypothetical protein